MARPAMFHHFVDGARHPAGQGAINADQFTELLQHLGLSNILSAEEWYERFLTDRLDPQHTCLTLDDNLRSQYDVALPVMDAYGLTAFWFVYSSPLEDVVERVELYRYFRTVAFDDIETFYDAFFTAALDSPYRGRVAAALDSFDPKSWHAELAFYTDDDRRFRFLRDGVLAGGRYDSIMGTMIARSELPTRQEIIDLLWMDEGCWRRLASSGHIIGMHTHTHPTALENLPIEDQQNEYQRNSRRIQQAIGQTPDTAAHPSGSYSRATLGVLRDLGVRVAFAVASGVQHDPQLEVQRRDSADLMVEAGMR